MRRSNFALRVPPTLLDEARKAAESEGVALNQLITLALAEKVSAMRTEEYFTERALRADATKVTETLARVGKGNPPMEGDEIPLAIVTKKSRKKAGKRDGAVAKMNSGKRAPRT
jgi:HicB family